MISTIGVVGAGQMGCGIAQVAATAGFKCIVSDLSEQALSRGKFLVEQSLIKLEAKGLVQDKEAILSRISWATVFSKLSSCDLLIEAVVENEAVKKEVLSAACKLLDPQALIASNTSSISITRLARATNRPQNFIGMHFMNPVPLMKLVEIIKGQETSEHTLRALSQSLKAWAKPAP